MAVAKTKQERASRQMRMRLAEFCREHFPGYFEKGYKPIELNFVADMTPHEVWRADFVRVSEEGVDEFNTESIYLVWNGREVMGYEDDDAEGAFFDVLTEQKEKRSRERMAFLASPLIVSGVLAIGLLALIAYMLIETDKAIPQLWTVFTAVIAFYFGKGGWAAIQKREKLES